MQNLLFILFISFSSAFVLGQDAEFKFEDKNIKHKKVEAGTDVEFNYILENTGDIPLILNDYKVSCPCTKAYLPEKPIAPGEKFTIKVTFDTKDKLGLQDRRVIIDSNAKNQMVLRFRIVVKNEHYNDKH